MPLTRFMCLTIAFIALLSPIAHAADKPFDSHRDAEQDFLLAQRQATTEHKNIILDFGANWCAPCVALDNFLHEDPRLTRRLERGYVVVHIDTGIWLDSKSTKAVRNRYPKFKAIPHILFVAPDGTLLHDASKDPIAANPKKNIYDYEALAALLDKWAPSSHIVPQTSSTQ